MNFIDKAIGFFSPQEAFRRQQYRRAIQVMGKKGRRYEAAARGRRTAGWHTQTSSASEEARANLDTLRSRCRDLTRNNDSVKFFEDYCQ